MPQPGYKHSTATNNILHYCVSRGPKLLYLWYISRRVLQPKVVLKPHNSVAGAKLPHRRTSLQPQRSKSRHFGPIHP